MLHCVGCSLASRAAGLDCHMEMTLDEVQTPDNILFEVCSGKKALNLRSGWVAKLQWF